MGFGGHVQDMINRVRMNREQRPSNRAKFKGDSPKNMHSADKQTEGLNFISLPENKLIEIKKQIRERAKAKYKGELILFGVIMAIGLIAMFVFL